MAVPTYYIQPTGDLIYTQLKVADANVASGSSASLTFGLEDIADLPGQSTWFVNRLHFQLHVVTELDGIDTGITQGRFMAGIIPRGEALTVFNDLGDFEDLIAWPLKGVMGYTAQQGSENPANNKSTVSRTYSPRDVLVLNRGQNITWAWYNIDGPDCWVMMSIIGQFKRGE